VVAHTVDGRPWRCAKSGRWSRGVIVVYGVKQVSVSGAPSRAEVCGAGGDVNERKRPTTASAGSEQ
jgi:hypothetical protein